MSAHTVASVVGTNMAAGFKSTIITFTGSASYDANGSDLALGSAATGLDVHSGFASSVLGGTVLKITGTGADKYFATVIPGSGTTVKVVVRDAEAMTAAAEVSGDISGLTFTAIFHGI